MNLGLESRTALVMGASGGIGKSIAQTLVKEGARVAICARHPAKVAAAAAELGAEGIVADLSAPGGAAGAVRQAEERLGRVDVLVVNTGGPPPGLFTALEDGTWRTAFEGLWMSSVGAIRAALPGMQKRRWGRIVVITSIAAKEPVPTLMLSNSLRAGLHGLVNALSKEVAPDGITINALMPGFTLTERLGELKLDLDKLATQIPARRIGQPEDLAAVAAFLASGPASYLTGQAIAVDGGLQQSI
ncbi:MAG: SDR family oxidoreductase [Gammaproteobacteria bacterium]|nr:SDR family oxidoreductase [Gammaproteobacteria bacterium]MBV9697319.1 SDR family oxidoreductase [Gammaproteobacteria bacterium]